jgi:IS30 family transposase
MKRVSGDTGRYLIRQEGVATMTYHQLTQEERYLISAHLAAGRTPGEIARLLSRSPSTVSRELQRNATTHDGRYRPSKAHRYAEARRRRCRRGSQYGGRVYRQIEAALRNHWSPEQIVGHFRAQGMCVPSHETIYRHLRRDKRRGGSLYRHTRIMSKVGRKRYRSRPARGVLLGKPHISQRPRHIERRRQVGHWEGDTVMGRGASHCLVTLVERATGLAIVKKIAARNKALTTRAIVQAIRRRGLTCKSITFDNGTEFHGYRDIEDALGVKCYFATPYHSWERGSNENFNGLLRQYLPKGTSFRHLKQARCDRIERALNTRPRKRYRYKTPVQMYARSHDGVALVG